MSKEDFKEFVKTKPELVDYVEDGSMTWQKFYELYDLFGNDNSVWSRYTKKSKSSFSDFVSNIDVDAIQKHIESAQKALSFVSELTSKGSNNVTDTVASVASDRPINKIFGD